MDVKAYINTGILERYVLGETSAEEDQEITMLKNKYAEVKDEIEAIETSLEKLSLMRGVTPPNSAKTNLFDKVDVIANDKTMQDKLQKRKDLLNQKINKLK